MLPAPALCPQVKDADARTDVVVTTLPTHPYPIALHSSTAKLCVVFAFILNQLCASLYFQ